MVGGCLSCAIVVGSEAVTCNKGKSNHWMARLAAGGGIDPHIDVEPSNSLTHKIHVPLVTNPKAMLTVAGAELHLPAGRALEVNNLAPHSAFNGGEQDRIHFIFEVFEGAGAPKVQWDFEESLPV